MSDEPPYTITLHLFKNEKTTRIPILTPCYPMDILIFNHIYGNDARSISQFELKNFEFLASLHGCKVEVREPENENYN